MSWDVHSLCLLLIIVLYVCEGHGKCVSTSSTKLCKDSCPDTCPGPSSCPKQCVHCKDGFYGSSCLRRCKGETHCRNEKCVLLPSGRALNCSEGCRIGWRGLSCNTHCKHPCLECDRYTGDCIGQCRDGYHGSQCSQRCPETCIQCDKDTGICTGDCARGFYGDDCLKYCPDHCQHCDKDSGKCISVETTIDSSSYVEQLVFIKDETVVVEERHTLFTSVVLGVLAGVSLLAFLAFLLCTSFRKHTMTWQHLSLSKQGRTDSCEPLTIPEPDHVNDELSPDATDCPVSKPTTYITPVHLSHNCKPDLYFNMH